MKIMRLIYAFVIVLSVVLGSSLVLGDDNISIEKFWLQGIALCSNSQKLRADLSLVQIGHGEYAGELFIGGIRGRSEFVGSQKIIVKREKDRYYFENTRGISPQDYGRLQTANNGKTVYFKVDMMPPCSDFFVVGSTNVGEIVTNAFMPGLNNICPSYIFDWLKEAAHPKQQPQKLKERYRDLLPDYNTRMSALTYPISDAVFKRHIGRSFYTLSDEQINDFFWFIRDCTKYSFTGHKTLKYVVWLFGKEQVDRWKKEKPISRRGRWNFNQDLELSEYATEILRVAQIQSQNKALLLDDIEKLRRIPESREAIPTIHSFVRQRSRALSYMPLLTIESYLLGIEGRLNMLKAARELADRFSLTNLPKLPAPSSETDKLIAHDEALEPLSSEEIRELSQPITLTF